MVRLDGSRAEIPDPLIHYSRGPLGEIRDRSREQRPGPKPRGLWVSVEDGWGWRDWCEAEEYGDISRARRYRIRLAADAEVLWLRGASDIDRFHAEYAERWEAKFYLWEIRWPEVAERWDGIIIAPYVWERRLGSEASTWYYPWDCSSGCIWKPRAIAGVEKC